MTEQEKTFGQIAFESWNQRGDHVAETVRKEVLRRNSHEPADVPPIYWIRHTTENWIATLVTGIKRSGGSLLLTSLQRLSGNRIGDYFSTGMNGAPSPAGPWKPCGKTS